MKIPHLSDLLIIHYCSPAPQRIGAVVVVFQNIWWQISIDLNILFSIEKEGCSQRSFHFIQITLLEIQVSYFLCKEHKVCLVG